MLSNTLALETERPRFKSWLYSLLSLCLWVSDDFLEPQLSDQQNGASNTYIPVLWCLKELTETPKDLALSHPKLLNITPSSMVWFPLSLPALSLTTLLTHELQPHWISSALWIPQQCFLFGFSHIPFLLPRTQPAHAPPAPLTFIPPSSVA